MKHRISAAVVVLSALAGMAVASLPEPAFRCNPAPNSWQIRCEVTSFPWGALREPTFEVYAHSGDSAYNTDIDTGLLVYMSRGRLPLPFAVVMKTKLPGRLHVAVQWFDAGRRRTG